MTNSERNRRTRLQGHGRSQARHAESLSYLADEVLRGGYLVIAQGGVLVFLPGGLPARCPAFSRYGLR